MKKTDIRSKMLSLRDELSEEEIRTRSLKMTDDIVQDSHYEEAKILYLYFPFRHEIDTNYLIVRAIQDGKTIAVPVCLTSGDMVFERIEGCQVFHTDRYHILEPLYNPNLVVDGSGLMIVPLVGYCGKNRVGFGKNYYNNYLADRPYLYTIGVAYDFQEVDSIDDLEENSVPLNEIRSY